MSDKGYKQELATVTGNEETAMLWDMQIHTDRELGVRQGCPLSPSLFILAVELLALKIRENRKREGIYLPNNQEVKILQFADDTTIITNNTDSLKSHLQTIE